MIAARKDALAKSRQETKKENNSQQISESDNRSGSTSTNRGNLPSYAKKLDSILKLELLVKESSEKIGSIWNEYHSGKDCVSASIPSDFYFKLSARGKQFPMVNFVN